jgi:hypothetical protein
MAKGVFGGSFKGVDGFGKVGITNIAGRTTELTRHRLWKMSRLRLERARSVSISFMFSATEDHTLTRGLVTLLSAAIILTFTMIEFFDYRRINVDTSIVVDKSRGEKLTVHMGITFPHVPCYRMPTLYASAKVCC